MEFLSELWLPILLSAVFVFVASSLLHMALPWHMSDYKPLPDEEPVMDALRRSGAARGEFFFPHCGSMKEAGTPEFRAKLERGPSGSIIVQPKGGLNMGKSLLSWFVLCILISVLIAYLANLALAPGAAYMDVFRFTGAAGVLGYAFLNVTNSQWKGLPWGIAAKFVVDGIVYALVTAGTFGWLWP